MSENEQKIYVVEMYDDNAEEWQVQGVWLNFDKAIDYAKSRRPRLCDIGVYEWLEGMPKCYTKIWPEPAAEEILPKFTLTVETDKKSAHWPVGYDRESAIQYAVNFTQNVDPSVTRVALSTSSSDGIEYIPIPGRGENGLKVISNV